MATVMIIVTSVRDVRDILFVPEEEAQGKANKLLREHIANNGFLDEFEEGIGCGIDWDYAHDGMSAWSSVNGINWNAHIVRFEDCANRSHKEVGWKDHPDSDYYELYYDGRDIATLYGPGWSEFAQHRGYNYSTYPTSNWCINHEPVEANTLEDAKRGVEKALADIYASVAENNLNATLFYMNRIAALKGGYQDEIS